MEKVDILEAPKNTSNSFCIYYSTAAPDTICRGSIDSGNLLIMFISGKLFTY